MQARLGLRVFYGFDYEVHRSLPGLLSASFFPGLSAYIEDGNFPALVERKGINIICI